MNFGTEVVRTQHEVFDAEFWEVDSTVNYIKAHGHKCIALQLPDDLLQDSPLLATAVQQACSAAGHPTKAHILADTTFNPLGVDEVAAAHIRADCVVHYGRASLSPVSRVPAFFVFGRQPLQVAWVARRIAAYAASLGGEPGRRGLLVLPDQPYAHAVPALRQALDALQQAQRGMPPTAVAEAACTSLEPQGHTPCRGAATAAHDRRGAVPGAAAQDGCRREGCYAPAVKTSCAADGEGTQRSSAGDAGGGLDEARGLNESFGSSRVAGGPGAGDSGAGKPAAGGASPSGSAGLKWNLPDGLALQDCVLLWLGPPDVPALAVLQMSHAANYWVMYDPGAEGPAGPDGAVSAAAPARAAAAASAARAGPAAAAGAAAVDAPTSAGAGASAGPAGVDRADTSGGGGDAGRAEASASGGGSGDDCWREGVPVAINRLLRRRYYLVQKARDAAIVGILVGTLGVAGYLGAVAAVRQLAELTGKKTYTVLMGKPSPAKLANFPEMEIWVMVSDPQAMILDSKEYLAPVITPYEAQIAFSLDQNWGGEFRPGFETLLETAPMQGARLSEEAQGQPGDGHSAGVTALVQLARSGVQLGQRTGCGTLAQVRSAADYLATRRSWTGLEAPVVGAPPKEAALAVQGRTGRAAGYDDEPAAAPNS